MSPPIRHATQRDLVRINEIYNSYIVGRHTSFDKEPWDLADREAWFEGYSDTGRYQVLVVDVDGAVGGFACSSRFRSKAGYDRSVETTVVLDESLVGRGLGAALLRSLLDRLDAEEVHRAYALIALPNDASVVMHRRLGYRDVGELNEVGHKLGEYHSVLIMELRLT